MLTKPIRKERKTKLKVNNDVYRIGRSDERNFTIELLAKPIKPEAKEDWNVMGYYGNIEDMVWGLIKLSTGIPKHEDLVEQVKLLRQELKQTEKVIVAQLKEVLENV